MISIEKEAKTVDEAIRLGLEQLALEEKDVEIEVLEEGGIFTKSKVRLTVKSTPKEELCEFLEGLLDRMGVDCYVDVTETENGYLADISGKDSAVVIGYRGEVLDALQYIATINLNKQEKSYTRLTLDVEGYRARRVETLKQLALRLAEKADRTGIPQELEPMSTVDRKAIHEALANDERVTTESQGEEPQRHVVISPKERPVTYGTSKEFKTSGTKTRSFGVKKRRF
jgi:spoIIIJ-associated protein